MYKFTAFNGTVWTTPISMFLEEAITAFLRDTGLHEQDIKLIEKEY
jgi:hypothetical protein